MPLGDYARLKSALPQTTWADATALIRDLRMVKFDPEIAEIAHICAIASDAFRAVPDMAFAGQPLAQTFSAFKMALLQCGADDVPYLVGGAERAEV